MFQFHKKVSTQVVLNLGRSSTHPFANKSVKSILKSSISRRTFTKTLATGLFKKYANAASATIGLSGKQCSFDFWYSYISSMQWTRFSTRHSPRSWDSNRLRASSFNPLVPSWRASMKILGCFKRPGSSSVSIKSMTCKLLEIRKLTKPLKCHGSVLRIVPLVKILKYSPDRVWAGTIPVQHPRRTYWMFRDVLVKPGTLKPHYHAVGRQIYACLTETESDIRVLDVVEKPLHDQLARL